MATKEATTNVMIGDVTVEQLAGMHKASLDAERERVKDFGTTYKVSIAIREPAQGVCTLIGYEQKPGRVARLTRNGTLVVKWSGQSYWRGIGMDRGYAPAKFTVYRIKFVDTRFMESNGRLIAHCDEITEFDAAGPSLKGL